MAVDVSTALPGGDPGRFLRNQPDEALVAFVLQGSEAAFEVIYDRHHRGMLAFCRHMLRSREEAEDALQHTFAAAYRSLTSGGERPNALKPWLYAIARNRCLTVIRARQTRDAATEAEADASTEGTAVEGLADAVQRRADLQDLVSDMHRLPDDQRAALVLFEMGDHSHAEIADVLDVDRTKVKALVFQAREGLMRARTARDTPCAEIRRHLSSRTRALPRRGVIKGHLDTCPACAAYDLEVRRQRAALAMVLPVVPSLELKGSVLGPLLGTGATVAAGGAAVIGTGAGTAAIGTGTLGSGALGAGAGGLAAAGAGAGSGLTGGAAIGGIGALAANAVVAKVVTVVAVAGAAAGAGQAIKAHDAPNHRPASATNTAVVTTSKPVRPAVVRAPAPPEPTTTTTIVPPRVVHQTVVHHPPAASGTSATTASAPAGAKPTGTPAPAKQDPADSSAPASDGTAADGTDAGGSAPADPAPSTDPGASGSAPSTPPDTTTPPPDEQVVGASELPPDEPAADPASDPTATAVTCPSGTVPVATNPTAIPPATPSPTDPATAPPRPTLTLADGTVVPIPDGCGFLPVVSETTAGADPSIAAAAAAAAGASAAAATAPGDTPSAP